MYEVETGDGPWRVTRKGGVVVGIEVWRKLEGEYGGYQHVSIVRQFKRRRARGRLLGLRRHR